MKVQLTNTQSIRLLRKMLAKGQYIFTIDEASKVTRMQKKQLSKLLTNMVAGGWLLRLHRGVYASTGGMPGEISIPSFAIATHLVQPSAIGYWSAMQHHGFTEQIPQSITSITTRKVVTPSMRKKTRSKTNKKHALQIKDIRYEYITIKPDKFFGIEELWIDEHFRIPITDKERTLLDGFIHPKFFGGMGEILGILEASLAQINIKKLVDYATRYQQKSVAKRLGWALSYFGVSDRHLAPLLRIPTQCYFKLDPSGLRTGNYDKKWRIQNNLRVNI